MSGKRQLENPYRFLAAEILRLAPCDRIAFALPLPDGSGFNLTGAYPRRANTRVKPQAEDVDRACRGLRRFVTPLPIERRSSRL